MRSLPLLLATLAFAVASHAQWQMQTAHSTADLRGIDSLGHGVAWASGTNGTVLRTEDSGSTWQLCTVPPEAKRLDFRGVQAFDSNTAIAMSSGKGDLSRLYKTTDGCHTWKQVFTNPDETGFFDALHRVASKQLFLLGDPVGGKFSLFTSRDAGDTWFIEDDPGLESEPNAGAFAASNSSFMNLGTDLAFGTGAPEAAVYRTVPVCDAKTAMCTLGWQKVPTSLAHGQPTQGVFSLAGHLTMGLSNKTPSLLVAVGGNYDKATEDSASAALSRDGGKTWTASKTMPHGYRSAVAYDPKTDAWITVGPNGTDLSTDDGRNWRALKPSIDAKDALDADQRWNAISLPFVVGPQGRIGILRPEAISR